MALAKADWNAAQISLDENPTATDNRTKERDLAKQHMQLCKDEEAFYKQKSRKSRIQRLQLGDKNTKFFYNSYLHRQARNKIICLLDETGNHIKDKTIRK